ncbi:MAG TPA: transglutaminase domain-containing protein [Thermoplasmata archaeon]|nr:transglutaminase domain-containing protein [Thermoplasmata archaeon]
MQIKIRYLILSLILIASVLLSIFLYTKFEEAEKEKQILIVKKFQPRLLRQSPLLLKKEDFEQLSPWQKYVTPFDSEVQKIANEIKNEREAYKTAVKWTWVSDITLNGVEEKWLMPHEFLSNTPNYPTNPVPGKPASDCEEQAYTLVSLLRAIGVKAENVRVVVGEVNFSGQRGGHAWVEIYENGKWFALEATSGSYWDDEEKKFHDRRGYPYTYFKNHEYPSVEIWGYFNDIYYYNPSTEEGNAPFHWKNVILMPS